MDSDYSQNTKEWPMASIDLEKLKDSFLLLKQKMCKTHELIQRYNDKLKECECLKTERDTLKKEAKKITYNYNTALAKIIKLEHQNTEYKKNNENLLKTVNEYEIKISSDQQLTKQLSCKMKNLEEEHSGKIMELDLEKSCLKEKVKDLEQELKTLKKSSTVKLKKLEKKGNDVENDSTAAVDLPTARKLMQDAATNTDTETSETVKPETCEKCIITDEFYSLKDNPYPIFCSKCEAFLNPPPIDKICEVMRKCPPLLDNMLSPEKKVPIPADDVPEARYTNEEEMPFAEIRSHRTEEISEGNRPAANSQSSSTLNIKTLEKKVNALESKLKKESRRRSTSVRNCCPSAHHYCNNFNGKNTFDLPIYPSILSEFCKTLMDANKESKNRRNSNKRSLSKFTSKKVKLKNNKSVRRKTGNPWCVETILKKDPETDPLVGEKRRKLKRKKSARAAEKSEPRKCNESFVNETYQEHPCSISSNLGDDIKVDDVTVVESEDCEVRNDSNLNKSMNDMKNCSDKHINGGKEEILIIETKNAAGARENVITIDDDDEEKYRFSNANGMDNGKLPQSAKEEVGTFVKLCLSTEEKYSANKYNEHIIEVNVNECETQDEKTCNHSSNETDEYLCSLCGKLVKGDKSLQDYPAINKSDENMTDTFNDSEDRIQHEELSYANSTSVADGLEDTTEVITICEFKDEAECTLEKPEEEERAADPIECEAPINDEVCELAERNGKDSTDLLEEVESEKEKESHEKGTLVILSDSPRECSKEENGDEKSLRAENREELDEIPQARKRRRGRPPKAKDTIDSNDLTSTSKDVQVISTSQSEGLDGKQPQQTAEEMTTTKKKTRGRPAGRKLKAENNRVNLMKKLRLLKRNNCVLETSCPSSQGDTEVDTCGPTKKRRVARSPAVSSVLSSTSPCEKCDKPLEGKDMAALSSLRRSCRVVVKKLEQMDGNIRDIKGNNKEDVLHDDNDELKKTELHEEYKESCAKSNRKITGNGTMTINAVDDLHFSSKTCENANMKCRQQPGLNSTKNDVELRNPSAPCHSPDNVTPEKGHFEVPSRSSPRKSGDHKDSNSTPLQRSHFIPITSIGLLTQPKSKVLIKRKVGSQRKEEEEESDQLNESPSSIVNSINRNVEAPLDKSVLVSPGKSDACNGIRKDVLSNESPNMDRFVHRESIETIPTDFKPFDSSSVNVDELPVTPMSPENFDTETFPDNDNITIIPTTPESNDLPAKYRDSMVNSQTNKPMSEKMDQLVVTPMSPEKSSADVLVRLGDIKVIPTSPKHAQQADLETVHQSPLALFKNMCANYRRKYKRKRGRESKERKQEATDAFVRKQLRRILDSSEWSAAVHRDIVAKLLSSCSDRIIAKGIVEAVMDESYNKLLDKQYTPPAPPMTKAQQKYLALLLELSASKPAVFHYVEQGILYKLFRLNNTPKWPEMERLIRMYVVMARVQKNREKVRIFCLDALYCLGHAISLVFEIVLTSWPEVLPMCGANSEIIPKVIVHVLMMQTGKDVILLKKMLMKYYKYPSTGYSTKDLLQEMLAALESGNCNGLDTGLILLAKHVGVSWTYENIIRDGLLQSIVANKHPDVYRAFCLLGNLMRAFPLNDPDGVVGKIIEQLIDLLESGEGSAEQQEGVASALISLSRHKPCETMNSVLNWTPLRHLTARTVKQLEMTFASQTPESWNGFIKKIERSKKKLLR